MLIVVLKMGSAKCYFTMQISLTLLTKKVLDILPNDLLYILLLVLLVVLKY